MRRRVERSLSKRPKKTFKLKQSLDEAEDSLEREKKAKSNIKKTKVRRFEAYSRDHFLFETCQA